MSTRRPRTERRWRPASPRCADRVRRGRADAWRRSLGGRGVRNRLRSSFCKSGERPVSRAGENSRGRGEERARSGETCRACHQRGDGGVRYRCRPLRGSASAARRLLSGCEFGFARHEAGLFGDHRPRGRPLCRSRGDDADRAQAHRITHAARRTPCGGFHRPRVAPGFLGRRSVLANHRPGLRDQDVPQRHHQGHRGAASGIHGHGAPLRRRRRRCWSPCPICCPWAIGTGLRAI